MCHAIRPSQFPHARVQAMSLRGQDTWNVLVILTVAVTVCVSATVKKQTVNCSQTNFSPFRSSGIFTDFKTKSHLNMCFIYEKCAIISKSLFLVTNIVRFASSCLIYISLMPRVFQNTSLQSPVWWLSLLEDPSVWSYDDWICKWNLWHFNYFLMLALTVFGSP